MVPLFPLAVGCVFCAPLLRAANNSCSVTTGPGPHRASAPSATVVERSGFKNRQQHRCRRNSQGVNTEMASLSVIPVVRQNSTSRRHVYTNRVPCPIAGNSSSTVLNTKTWTSHRRTDPCIGPVTVTAAPKARPLNRPLPSTTTTDPTPVSTTRPRTVNLLKTTTTTPRRKPRRGDGHPSQTNRNNTHLKPHPHTYHNISFSRT